MDKNKQRAAILCVLMIVFFGCGSSAASTSPSPSKTIKAPLKTYNRDTIQAYRSALEEAGSVVTWDEKKHTITIKEGTDSFYLDISTDATEGIPIYVDNEYIGKSPVKKRLFAGKYQVTAKPRGHVASIRYLTLTAGTAANQANVDRIVLPVDYHNYGEFLDELIRNGYKPIRVMDFYQNAPVTKKTIVLRHDVDVSAAYALKMAKMEYEKGITSSYYFRWSSADARVISEIRKMGFEVGLHYETLATYAIKNKLKSAKDITPEIQRQLRSQLKDEIAEFSQKYGKIDTIASHGADENIQLGITNYKAIMEGQNPQEFGIIGCAYGPITKDFTYMSDSGGIWDPFPYPNLTNDKGPFYILVHPVHWKDSIQVNI